MSLRVYNSLTDTKEIFEPVHPGKVGIYLCGPTVYKSPHIGHMVGPVIFDAIKRYLTFKGYDVTWVVNITDVEDKLIDASHKTGMSVDALSEKYGREYLECLETLGVRANVNRFPKASEHIGEIVAMCEKLIEKGHAYAAEGNVYFDVAKDADYGKLSNRKVEEQEAGTRAIEATGKRNPADFALWKAAKPGEPKWDSPWGAGRPGWHIECSAMSMKYLGETFDMHGGGMDLLFPHHENELAQSESATGKTFAKYWLHNGLTRLNTKKMSGSVGNVVAAKALLDQHGPELIRYMLLTTHYRSPIEFSDEVLTAAKKGISTFFRLFERAERLGVSSDVAPGNVLEDALKQSPGDKFLEAAALHRTRFLEMMDDDFNTAGAIGVLHELAGEVNRFVEQTKLETSRDEGALRSVGVAVSTVRHLGGLLGLFQQTGATTSASRDGSTELVGQLMSLLIDLRQESRKTKNFAMADTIRKRLTELGVTLEDRAEGTIWRKE
jgi:cysteinyl-tRNA synthetase